MSDQTDASLFDYLFRGGTGEVEKVISSEIPFCDREADFYNVKNKRRGIAVIFNHQYFDDKHYNSREGTNKDRDYLNKVLSRLDFEVRIYNDLKYGQIHQVISDVSKENHSDADCLVVCVMSHGEEGKLNARDHAYPPDILWMPFAGDKCQSLAGKPKLFFIQACRGSEVDDGATVRNTRRTEADSSRTDETYTIPAMADILVMYSTYQGYFSWRSPDKGSWFIQALCKELEENCYNYDLLTMLTFVNRRVAITHQSHVPQDRNMHTKKQVCTIVSMLTRLMIFPPKNKSFLESDRKEGVEEKKNTDKQQ